MKILIDTQVFIWLINEPSKLRPEAFQSLKDPANQLHISYFSFFEMTIKASIGKLRYDSSVLEDLSKMGIELIMPDTLALRSYEVYNPANRDPFDNILVAIALNERCAFMTSDEKILAIQKPGLKLLSAV